MQSLAYGRQVSRETVVTRHDGADGKRPPVNAAAISAAPLQSNQYHDRASRHPGQATDRKQRLAEQTTLGPTSLFRSGRSVRADGNRSKRSGADSHDPSLRTHESERSGNAEPPECRASGRHLSGVSRVAVSQRPRGDRSTVPPTRGGAYASCRAQRCRPPGSAVESPTHRPAGIRL